MGIEIGNIDIGKTLIDLEFQTKFNSLLIELLLNNVKPVGVTQETIEQLKDKAAEEINKKYGKEMLTKVK